MKITLDACLFAAQIDFQNTEHTLDIGSGTGLLSLFLAQRYPNAQIDAIELDGDASAQCASNFMASPFHGRLRCTQGDIRTFSATTPYSAIVCNPPFFTSGVSSHNSTRAQARHAYGLPIADLIAQIKILLAPDGECWLLLGSEALSDLEKNRQQHGLFITQQINLQARADKPVHRHFVKLEHKLRPTTHSTLIAYQAGTEYSPQATSLLADFFIRL